MNIPPTFHTAAERQAYHRALGEPYLLGSKPDPVRLKALERVLSSKPKRNVHIRALEEFCTREDIMSLSIPYEVLTNEWGVRIGQLKSWKRLHRIQGPRGRVWIPCNKPGGPPPEGGNDNPVGNKKLTSSEYRDMKDMRALRSEFESAVAPIWLPMIARNELLQCIKRGSEIGRKAAYDAFGIPTESLLTASITSATMNLIEGRFWFAVNKKPRKSRK